jgi:phosphatidylglycerophosphatase A
MVGSGSPAAPRSAAQRLLLAWATLGFVGFLPGPRGTWAALAALPVCWLLALPGSIWLYGAALLAVAATSVPAAGAAERLLGGKDPKPVVIDEAAGMLLTMFAVPMSGPALTAGFLLFRLFDVAKVFPANRLERLPGGLGIVADDLMAAIYANLALRAGLRLWTAIG